MTEIILFIVTTGFIVGITLAEAKHDYWVIIYQSFALKQRYPKNTHRWKFWGNFYELAWITFYVITIYYFTGFGTVFFWIPILWLIRTIFHDGFIALFLDEKFSYVSDTGFDGKMKAMFQGSGAFYLAGKLFILAILIMSYISVKFNLDLWQMILNIFR